MQILANLFNKKKKSPPKVLSFDGGGVRAIAGIVFLQKLEAYTGKKITDVFDMFVGTSAGAFNASCLAFDNMDIAELKKYWSKDYLDRIMDSSFFWDQASLIQARPRYETKGRLKLLNEIFGNKSLGESRKPVVTLCYDIEKRKHIIHSTYNTPEISFVDAVCASSAAPMYFPTYKMNDGSWMIDGGVVTNNPTLIGFNHAKKFFANDTIKVMSIGTGINKKTIPGEASSKWGGIGWLRNDIMGMLLDSEIHNDIATDILGDSYLRINSPMGRINRMLDDDSDDNLEKIHLMGLDWWSKYGESAVNFIED
jgi:patatin-like phospholipase/acyl hydrolase